METAIRLTAQRPELVIATPTLSGEPVTVARALSVSATYFLSETGRKASLLSGGNGRAVQQIQVQVPVNRLHLVSVSGKGVARLKLRPRFERDGQDMVLRIDAPPTYDSPPTIDDLFREAARNHELERSYHAARKNARTSRRRDGSEWRSEVAAAFLQDSTQRALTHPSPSSRRCSLATERGRVYFDIETDHGLAHDVPAEAFRRFRADLNAARERKQQLRAEGLKIHEEKKQVVAAWIAEHGASDQQARQAVGMLPMDEAVEAMADDAFRALADRPRYVRDGSDRLQTFLRRFSQHHDVVINGVDLVVSGRNAGQATRSQWALLQEIQTAVPDAKATLRLREISWKCDLKAPKLTLFTVLVTTNCGAIQLRREFLAPSE